MHKMYLIIITLFLTCTLLAQDNLNQTGPNGKKQGTWVKYYSNGNKKYQGEFKDGKPIGELVRYYPDGGVQARLLHLDNSPKVRARLYHDNGKIAARGIFAGTRKDSTWRYFSAKDGHLVSTEEWDKGQKEGVSKTYFENGQVAQEVQWEDGQKHGLWRTCFPNGEVKFESRYQNGLLDGLFVIFYPSGRPEITGNYQEGEKHGEWVQYDRDGKKLSVIRYEHGVPENEDELLQEELERFEEYERNRHNIQDPEKMDPGNPGYQNY